jgi:hypothetical protein
MPHRILVGDCREVLRDIPAHSLDSCATDPPYNLDTINKRFGSENAAASQYGTDGLFQRQSRGFMGQEWDSQVAFDPKTWAAVLRVLKPGSWVAAMGGDRTHHRLMVAIEDAGFEIRHCVCWCYGNGFPKSLDVSKAIDKHLGAKREVVGRRADQAAKPLLDIRGGNYNAVHKRGPIDCSAITAPASEEAAAWEGWGTALKPSVEFIVLARAPLSENSVAKNVLKWGTGAINIDACRLATGAKKWSSEGGGGLGGRNPSSGSGEPIPPRGLLWRTTRMGAGLRPSGCNTGRIARSTSAVRDARLPCLSPSVRGRILAISTSRYSTTRHPIL